MGKIQGRTDHHPFGATTVCDKGTDSKGNSTNKAELGEGVLIGADSANGEPSFIEDVTHASAFVSNDDDLTEEAEKKRMAIWRKAERMGRLQICRTVRIRFH